MSSPDDLLNYLFDGRPSPLAREFEGWLRESRPFAAFADRYRAKIRAKLRQAADPDRLLDTRAELEAAARLLRESRFAVEYETYAAAKQRGPDLTVTFKGHTPFNVEVRRLRPGEPDEDAEARAARLAAVLLDKARQMPPGIANVLWLAVGAPFGEADLNAAALALRQPAERKAGDFFAARGYESAAGFLRQYQRLSAVLLHRPGAPVLWPNPLARHQIPSALAAALRKTTADR